MIDSFARLWWLVALRGIAGLALAVVSVVWPFLTLEALLIGFGLYAVADGAVALFAGLWRSHHGYPFWPFAIEGALGLLFGAVVLAFPDTMAFLLWYLIAGWALATGLVEIAAALRLRRAYTGETLLLGAGAASLIFGAVMLLWPRAAMVTLAWLVGVYAAMFGVLMLGLARRLRRLRASDSDAPFGSLPHPL